MVRFISRWFSRGSVSRVRDWADRRSSNGDEINEHPGDIAIWMLTRFADPQFGSSESDPFAGDSSVFEIGCYLFATLADHEGTESGLADAAIVDELAKRFAEVFEDIGRIAGATSLMEDRLAYYSPVLADGDLTQAIAMLEKLVLHTRNNSPPAPKATKAPYRLDSNVIGGLALQRRIAFFVELTASKIMLDVIPMIAEDQQERELFHHIDPEGLDDNTLAKIVARIMEATGSPKGSIRRFVEGADRDELLDIVRTWNERMLELEREGKL